MLAMYDLPQEMVDLLLQTYAVNEQREMHKFMEEGVSPSVFEFTRAKNGTNEEPRTLDECINLVGVWIDSKHFKMQGFGCMLCMLHGL